MSIKATLSLLRDELDSHGCVVDFKITADGIEIISRNYADKMIAKHELKRRNFLVVE